MSLRPVKTQREKACRMQRATLSSVNIEYVDKDISPESRARPRAAPSVRAHHRSVIPDTGRNSGERCIIEKKHTCRSLKK